MYQDQNKKIQNAYKKTKKNCLQILKGISYLHHMGYIHRNIKSDNILINSENQIKICDFALSKLTEFPHSEYTPEDPKDREIS